tara:strand:- start:34690 stop:34884 length:195 start_codon:yes stop_codon:yes gene_type:complete
MAKEKKDTKKVSKNYKASNPKTFQSNYTDIVPYYKELSEGESVKVDLKNKHVENWIKNKIIVKE